MNSNMMTYKDVFCGVYGCVVQPVQMCCTTSTDALYNQYKASVLLKTMLLSLLLLVLGGGNVWGQTEITALSQITDADGNYIIKNDISGGAPGVSTFSGTLTAQAKADGTFPVISGLSAPLFTTATNATISNIILDQVSISQGGITGSIACTANGTTSIYNCGILSGSVGSTGTSSGDNSDDCCGGLVGFLDGTARVINCYSYATITGGNRVGGIVGYNNYQTTSASDKLKTMVMNCMFYGDITGGQRKLQFTMAKKSQMQGKQLWVTTITLMAKPLM